jgi:[ribosomal protein S18]-alanine N-acetyltransferase
MSITTSAIRLAALAEAESIATLSRDTIEAGLPWRWQPTDIVRFIRSGRHNVIVAEESAPFAAPLANADSTLDAESRVMSGFAVMGYGDNEAYLALLSVKPEWRRKGVARSMAQWLIKCADVAGIKRIDVELRADNHNAYTLYQKLGFAEIARKPGGYYGTITQVRMRLRLRT